MKKMSINIVALVIACLIVIAASIWGPEALAIYKDKGIMNEVHAETVEAAGEGYRYTLSSNERLYLLSECLNAQTLPESDYNAMTKTTAASIDYQELTGTYAFVVNQKGPSGKEITDEEIYNTCNKGIQTLKEIGILPDSVKEVDADDYEAVLYSAIDVLEPRNNIAVWKLTLSSNQKNSNKENRLLDAYIDADSGKIYEFYVRTALTWNEIDTDEMIEKWSEYLGLSLPVYYETVNPLTETTPYFKKYLFSGMGEEKTVVTIGFYEGIHEIFLKISK